MKSGCIWFAAAAVAAITCSVHADEAKRTPRLWDQDKAIAKVKSLIAQEEHGDFAWDKISWMTDVDSAIRKSKSERKPIFLYFFLKGENGPAKAPC